MTDLFSNQVAEWQEEGYQAYLAGLRLPDNPYGWAEETREACVAWGRGWAWARTDAIHGMEVRHYE